LELFGNLVLIRNHFARLSDFSRGVSLLSEIREKLV